MTEVVSLDGTWSIATDPSNTGRVSEWFKSPPPGETTVTVPGIIQVPFPAYHGVAWYWREFVGSANRSVEGRFLLRFWAVDYLAEVWLNGENMGSHEGGETPFLLDVTNAILPGEPNLLAVRVLNPTNDPIDGMVLAEIPHRNKTVPHHTGGSYNTGGITESVELLLAPALRIADLFVSADPSTGILRIQTKVENACPREVNATLSLTVAPASTGEALVADQQELVVPPGGALIDSLLRLERPRLWGLGDPFLYRVSAHLEAQTPSSVDERSVRCGFRDFRVERGYFRLNGKRLFLRSTHTGNHCPVGQVIAPSSSPDLLRRDLLYAKASGFNMVRFIAGVAHPWQLDFCDEIGLLVYEESYAGWCLSNSAKMGERFDQSTGEMILRDRNHPSVVIWGLLNETVDSPVFRQAVASLPLVRCLDDSRLVLLSSGRWDRQWSIGSVSNPGGDTWEHVWGVEAPGAAPAVTGLTVIPGYVEDSGDAHIYPSVPHVPQIEEVIRTVGRDSKPVFVSEYGIGSLMNAIREHLLYQQSGESPEAEDAVLMRSMAESLKSDWERLGFDGVYAFPEDMLRESQRLHCRQRLLTFDLVRSNPNICGYNLTGMLDHGMTGEGVWTFWREWKPGVVDALSDGWAPLRWCLFVKPLHAYAGRSVTVEAVLANEDILAAGDYPVRLRIGGPQPIVWERDTVLRVPVVQDGEDGPLAIPVHSEEVTIAGPAGVYEFAAGIKEGAAPAGGRLRFFVSDESTLPSVGRPVVAWGADPGTKAWLSDHGVQCEEFVPAASHKPQVILVGDSATLSKDIAGWRDLAERLARGSVAVFATPSAFRRRRELVGTIDVSGITFVNRTDAVIENVAPDESPAFASEMAGDIVVSIGGLSDGAYTLELGMCELSAAEVDARVFDVSINGEPVLERFDIFREAGGRLHAVTRRFDAHPTTQGSIEVRFTSRKGCASLGRVRVFQRSGGQLIQELHVPGRDRDGLAWIPLPEGGKGRCSEFWDWLYHKECVAKAHPIFEGLQARGIMDWDYYGDVIPRSMFSSQETPDDVAAAAFAVGYPCPGGYTSGVLIGTYHLGAGSFLINNCRVLENLGRHPAADRLLVNMIRHAGSLTAGSTEQLPAGFETRLSEMGYV